ncbi:integration host factor subunit alpha [Dissulfurispira thermophila]|uniref:Integration host factor subunit alpha n=2 Tax=root TaxID=1 RepID=A0A7G1H2R6_9BACT|nr:integration host factor subunit alpha [Dissulfurispira thermophila]BCB96492.1 integration host factor subunit alpha [Dissulfurispira thermophila]
MTKADIVNLVFEKVGLPKNEVQGMVETVFDTIKQTLIAGESIKISGFGTFNVRKKNSRIGRNPKTKQEVEITPRRVVTFKASDQIKELIEKM